ncbi:MAG: glycosyltransferase [Phycisphaeraceae bacterium]|nr:glycosyltransferase [Phycisphaeraceae bacterium]
MPDETPSRSLSPATRVALAHDWLCTWRGGEMVLARIASILERETQPGTLYTVFDAGEPTGSPIDRWNRISSPLNGLPGAIRMRRWLMPLYPRAVGSLGKRLEADHANEPIDLLISTSSAAIKGLRSPLRSDGSRVPHLCYCHSPARYVWSPEVRGEYAGGGGLSVAALRAYGPLFRRWDRQTASNVTRFIANSSHTARLIERAYGRESTVIFPPVRTSFFTPDPFTMRSKSWLVVAALEPYKRVDLAIRAAGLAKRRLIVAGEGSMRARLEGIAREDAPGLVVFEGRVTDERLRELYRTAELLLFPQIEDFGIIACEAMACGMPVVARRAGGALDIVRDGVTGALFDEPTPEALIEATERVPRARQATSDSCEKFAARFAEDRFDRQMREAIHTCLSEGS